MYGENIFGGAPHSSETSAFLKAMPKHKIKLIKNIRAFNNCFVRGAAYTHVERTGHEWQAKLGLGVLRPEAVLTTAMVGNQETVWLPATRVRECRIRLRLDRYGKEDGIEQLVLEGA
ncbi:hypothetical protein LTR56_022106 [Elasticomyces elasticus]|nr:hypothetical protein LTR56_022106 [Elasticomyces elasticus]KAK3641996.1 hypothetical protein LTR22_016321 [Elasticomyces elasticus]KAK5748840.1 hypothetical protein LTS12_021078 [Elasticomyces elasticus]